MFAKYRKYGDWYSVYSKCFKDAFKSVRYIPCVEYTVRFRVFDIERSRKQAISSSHMQQKRVYPSRRNCLCLLWVI